MSFVLTIGRYAMAHRVGCPGLKLVTRATLHRCATLDQALHDANASGRPRYNCQRPTCFPGQDPWHPKNDRTRTKE